MDHGAVVIIVGLYFTAHVETYLGGAQVSWMQVSMADIQQAVS